MRKRFLIAILYSTAALLTLGTAFMAQSQITFPIGRPVVLGPPPLDPLSVPLHTGREYQEKAGDLGAYTYRLNANGGREAHIPSPVRVKQYQVPYSSSWSEPAYAFCDPGYRLLSCAGGRELLLLNLCSEEICAYVGTVPVDRYGFISIETSGEHEAIGCRTDIKGSAGEGERAVAFAFCIRDEF